MRASVVKRAGRRLYYGLFCALLVLPAAYVMICGFLGSLYPGRWGSLSLEHLASVLRSERIVSSLLQSGSLAIASSAVALASGLLMLTTWRYWEVRHGESAWKLASIPVVYPDILWGLGLLLVVRWGMADTGFMLLVLVHSAFNCALAYLILRPAVVGIPESRLEAARDLGAGYGLTVGKVMVPEILPTALGAFALCFVFSFDDFLLTFLLSGPSVETVPLFLYGKWKYGAAGQVVGLASASALFSAVVVLAVWKWAGVSKEMEFA